MPYLPCPGSILRAPGPILHLSLMTSGLPLPGGGEACCICRNIFTYVGTLSIALQFSANISPIRPINLLARIIDRNIPIYMEHLRSPHQSV